MPTDKQDRWFTSSAGVIVLAIAAAKLVIRIISCGDRAATAEIA
jgi:hypothetical protein